MTAHVKVGGAWRNVDSAWIKVGGVWRQVESGHVKQAGVWRNAYVFDDSVPPGPSMRLDLVTTRSTGVSHYVNVGIRFASAPTVPIRRVLVNVTSTGFASGPQQTSGYWTMKAVAGGVENFSDYWYNGNGGFTDGRSYNVWTHKRWARTMPWQSGIVLASKARYYFSAWAEGVNGKWSMGTFASLVTPRVLGPNEGVIGVPPGMDPDAPYTALQVRPLLVGTVDTSTGIFTEGIAEVAAGKAAVFFYGNDIKNLFPAGYRIAAGNLYLHRMNDSGQASAETVVGTVQTSAAELLAGSTKFQWANIQNKVASPTMTPKNSTVALQIPSEQNDMGQISGWQNAFAQVGTAIVIPLNPGNSVPHVKTYHAQENSQLQGTLRVSILPPNAI